MMVETDLGGAGGSFQSTQWTDVLDAKGAGSPRRREALERLIGAYWRPIYRHLRLRGRDVESSKDIAQGFFASLLEKDYLQYVDRERGKFRTFLRRALESYLSDDRDRATAAKRGGGRTVLSLDWSEAEDEAVAEGGDPERLFTREWALQVIRLALDAVRGEYGESGRQEEFEALRLHLDARSAEAPSYADLSEKLGVSLDDVKNRVHRARQRYRHAILREIRASIGPGEGAEEELRELFAALSG